MHESDAYYEEILYPLQSGVLSTLAGCEAPFYLTGGTALHRHFFAFRYCGAGEFALRRALNRFGERLAWCWVG